MRRGKLAALTTVAGMAMFASTASADTVTMGSTLTNDFEGGISTGPTLTVQTSYDPATSPNPVISPTNGVITGWKVKSADDGALYTLKVMRANGPVSIVTATNSNFTAVTSVQAPAPVPVGTFAATPNGAVFDYPASLPISKGDYIGLLTGGDDDHVAQKTTSGLALNVFANNFAGLPANGAAADLLADEQHDLLLQATVKFCKVPNIKRKKTKAAKKAIVAADCTPKIVRKPTGKKKLRGKVLKQKLAPGTTGDPGTTVKIVIGKKA